MGKAPQDVEDQFAAGENPIKVSNEIFDRYYTYLSPDGKPFVGAR